MAICVLCRCCWEPICSLSTTTRCSNQSESSSGVPSPVTFQAGEGGSARCLFCFGNKTKLSWTALKVALFHVSFCCQTFSAILFLFTGLFFFSSPETNVLSLEPPTKLALRRETGVLVILGASCQGCWGSTLYFISGFTFQTQHSQQSHALKFSF